MYFGQVILQMLDLLKWVGNILISEINYADWNYLVSYKTKNKKCLWNMYAHLMTAYLVLSFNVTVTLT